MGKLLIPFVGVGVLAAEYVTFLQFGPLRYILFVMTMLVPFLISLWRMEYGIMLVLSSVPVVNVFYYALNVRYSSIPAAIFMSVFLAWLARLFLGKARFVRNPLNLPTTAFAGTVILALLTSSFKLRGYFLGAMGGEGKFGELSFSVLRTGFILLCGAGAALFFANNLTDEGRRRRALWAMFVACLGVGVIGILEWVGGKEVFFMIPRLVREVTVVPPARGPLLISTFPQQNVLGNYCLLLLGPALGSCLAFSGYRRVLALVVVSLNIFCLLLSGNRTGWFGVAFASAFGLWLARREGAMRWNLGRAVVSSGLVLYLLYASVTSSGLIGDLDNFKVGRIMIKKVKLQDMAKTMLHGRLVLWRQAFWDWLSSPLFGIGPGTYPYYGKGRYHTSAVVENPFRGKGPINPHNYYIWLLCETGILGLGAFLWVLYRALKTGMERVRSAGGRWKFAYLGMVSSLAGYLLALTADHTLGFLEMQLVFWAVVGMLVQGPRSEVQSPKSKVQGL